MKRLEPGSSTPKEPLARFTETPGLGSLECGTSRAAFIIEAFILG